MRIIAGEFRGRPLLSPEGMGTRPITDRAKQSTFDILSPWMEGATVLDLFAGTGSLGLECLSRGAKHAMFVESDREAAKLLKKNISTFGVGNRSSVVGADALAGPSWYSGPKAMRFSVVFLDPPYRYLGERPAELQSLAAFIASKLAPESIVVFRHEAADSLELPPLVRYDLRVYGSMHVEFLTCPSTPTNTSPPPTPPG